MLFGTWLQAHAYDPSDYMETRLNISAFANSCCKSWKEFQFSDRSNQVKQFTTIVFQWKIHVCNYQSQRELATVLPHLFDSGLPYFSRQGWKHVWMPWGLWSLQLEETKQLITMLVKLAMLQWKCSCVPKLLGTELGTSLRWCSVSLQLYGRQP